MAVASAHGSLKSMSVNSPNAELAAHHCFLPEDVPDDAESTSPKSERDSKREGDQDDRNLEQDRSMLDDKASPNDQNEEKIEDDALEVNRQHESPDDGISEKPIAANEQAMVNQEEVRHNNRKNSSYSKLLNDEAPSRKHDSDGFHHPKLKCDIVLRS